MHTIPETTAILISCFPETGHKGMTVTLLKKMAAFLYVLIL
jgi:hypothetical protein